MALIVVGNTLRVYNNAISIRIYSTDILEYVRVLSTSSDFTTSLSADKFTVYIEPEGIEGTYNLDVQTTNGKIEIPIYFASKYEKNNNILNPVEYYYPDNLFRWDSKNPKYDEVRTTYDLVDSVIPKTNLIPIAEEFYSYWGSYCSSQLLGIAMQFAIQQYLKHNYAILVMYTDILPDATTAEDFISTASATTQDNTIFTPSSVLIPVNGINTLKYAQNCQNPDDKKVNFGFSYAANTFTYPSSATPEKYTSITLAGGVPADLKYGAVSKNVNELIYTGKGKVVYLGAYSNDGENVFTWDTTNPEKYWDKGIWDPETPPLPEDMTDWQYIPGMPASNEVVYIKSNINIDDLDYTVTIPSINKILLGVDNFIAWLSKINSNIQKVAIQFNGIDFTIRLKDDLTYFVFEDGNGVGFDEGVFL